MTKETNRICAKCHTDKLEEREMIYVKTIYGENDEILRDVYECEHCGEVDEWIYKYHIWKNDYKYLEDSVDIIKMYNE